MMTWVKNRLLLLLLAALTGVVLVIAVCNWAISYQAQHYIYDDIDTVPVNRVGIVLGTSRFTSDGAPNYHYRRRIEAAAALIQNGKIQFILVSGDNGTPWYDEPSRCGKQEKQKSVFYPCHHGVNQRLVADSGINIVALESVTDSVPLHSCSGKERKNGFSPCSPFLY